MNYDDEILMAYVDGELDAKLREEIAVAVENDPALARRVEQQRVLREKVAGAFAKVLDDPVPDRLHARRADEPWQCAAISGETGTRARSALACTRVGGDGREPLLGHS